MEEAGATTPEGRAAVVIPAAGSGSRMGGAPKQLRLLGDAPVLVQTLRAFARHPSIEALVVAAAPDHRAAVSAMLAAYDVEAVVVAGGTTRQASVGAGLNAVREGVDLVLVHDAVRPFIAADRIAAIVAAAHTAGAAALAVPVADTLRRAEDGSFGETVERSGLWRMQTPQAARLGWLRAAHAAAVRDGVTATDEVALLQRAGRSVSLVEGDPRNLKLTHPADWAVAEALWTRWSAGA